MNHKGKVDYMSFCQQLRRPLSVYVVPNTPHWHVWKLTGGRCMYNVFISPYMEAVVFMFFFALLQRNLPLPKPINKICHTKAFLKFSWAQVMSYCSYYDTVPFLSYSHSWKGEVRKILWYFFLSQCSRATGNEELVSISCPWVVWVLL